MYLINQLKYSKTEICINNKKLIEEADYIIMTTSIISHETEINFLNTNIAKNKKIFISGIFGNVLKDKYKLKNTFIVPGEPENFFLNLNLDKNELDGFFNGDQKTQINNYVDNLDDLPFPDWSYYDYNWIY